MTLTTGISRSRKMELWSQNRYKYLPTPFGFCGWIRNTKEEEQASEGSSPAPYHAFIIVYISMQNYDCIIRQWAVIIAIGGNQQTGHKSVTLNDSTGLSEKQGH